MVSWGSSVVKRDANLQNGFRGGQLHSQLLAQLPRHLRMIIGDSGEVERRDGPHSAWLGHDHCFGGACCLCILRAHGRPGKEGRSGPQQCSPSEDCPRSRCSTRSRACPAQFIAITYSFTDWQLSTSAFVAATQAAGSSNTGPGGTLHSLPRKTTCKQSCQEWNTPPSALLPGAVAV